MQRQQSALTLVDPSSSLHIHPSRHWLRVASSPAPAALQPPTESARAALTSATTRSNARDESSRWLQRQQKVGAIVRGRPRTSQAVACLTDIRQLLQLTSDNAVSSSRLIQQHLQQSCMCAWAAQYWSCRANWVTCSPAGKLGRELKEGTRFMPKPLSENQRPVLPSDPDPR